LAEKLYPTANLPGTHVGITLKAIRQRMHDGTGKCALNPICRRRDVRVHTVPVKCRLRVHKAAIRIVAVIRCNR
jgi:hypothetical protein